MVYFLYAAMQQEIENNLASHLNAFQFIAATFCLGPYPYTFVSDLTHLISCLPLQLYQSPVAVLFFFCCSRMAI